MAKKDLPQGRPFFSDRSFVVSEIKTYGLSLTLATTLR